MAPAASDPHLDLVRAPYVLYEVKYIDPVSRASFPGDTDSTQPCGWKRNYYAALHTDSDDGDESGSSRRGNGDAEYEGAAAGASGGGSGHRSREDGSSRVGISSRNDSSTTSGSYSIGDEYHMQLAKRGTRWQVSRALA